MATPVKYERDIHYLSTMFSQITSNSTDCGTAFQVNNKEISFLTHDTRHFTVCIMLSPVCILVPTDVAVSVCGCSGLWPFWFVAVPVCCRSGWGGGGGGGYVVVGYTGFTLSIHLSVHLSGISI